VRRAAAFNYNRSGEMLRMNNGFVWLLLFIPGSWLLSLIILLRDEWRARKLYHRDMRYR
jgi:hypothetical protein